MEDYFLDQSRIEELTQKELTNDKTISTLEIDENEATMKELNRIQQQQIHLLKEKNNVLNSSMRKLEKVLQQSKNIDISPFSKQSKVVNIEQLDFLADSNNTPFRISAQKLSNNFDQEKPTEVENPESYDGNLEDYIDKLNNNIEMIKKAFTQTAAEFEKPENVAALVESQLQQEEENEEKVGEFTKKKEKSLFIKPAGIVESNEGQRKYNSFNYKMDVESVEHALENSTFSLSILNRKLREYPQKIKYLEEEICRIKKEKDASLEEIETLRKVEGQLNLKHVEFNLKIVSLEEKNKSLLAELREKENLLKTQLEKREKQTNLDKGLSNQDIHYEIKDSLYKNEGNSSSKDQKLDMTNKKDCCRIF